MSISSKTRELLWSRAHNACALCRKALTVDADSAVLPGVIFGEEAHIVGQREDGPRGRDGSRTDIDGYDNLILLCADDHKRVDEQSDVFAVALLRDVKSKHEKWAAKRFTDEPTPEPNRTVKAPNEDSVLMEPLLSGRQIWDLLDRASIRYIRSVEGDVEQNVSDAADTLLDSAREWADIADMVENGFAAVCDAQRQLHELLVDAHAQGLFVYCRRVVRTLKGGHARPAPFPVAHMVVMTEEELREHGGIADPGDVMQAEAKHPSAPQ